MKLRLNIALILTVPFVPVAIFAASYLVRWIAVLIVGTILLAFILEEAELPYIPKRGEQKRRREDFERLADIIKMAKKGSVAKQIVLDSLLEIYEIVEEDREKAKARVENLKITGSGNKFLEDLEKVLEIVEADVNESRGSL
ncbi:hypothetical protein [Thermococcus sp. 2319x1]|uniref:hypothetical protein n=1 Tax=Thermococcus sp. 2319x1 TaxID=1674923 RepID=UPI001582BFAD|nr:hypothetical protein [Thermococcus sp. 2319x1]